MLLNGKANDTGSNPVTTEGLAPPYHNMRKGAKSEKNFRLTANGEYMNAQEAYLKNIQANYRFFCYYSHNKGREDNLIWYPSRFHKFLCDRVQEFVERPTDKAYEILIINTPPQHGKSETVTATFPAWYLMRNPDKNVILVSYGDLLAQRFGKKNLDKVKEFGSLFGVKLDRSKRNAQNFCIAGREGSLLSAGYGSGLTGNPASLIVIDDPVKNRMEADSETDRNKKWSDYIDSIESRICAGGKIILIMTRWHEDDLAGRLIEHYADRTTVINLPCEAEEEDPLGRNVGDALCPEIGKGNEWLADFKKAHMSEEGVRSWNALYQGHPSAREGNMLRREWWQYYQRSDWENGRIEFDNMLLSVDATFKDGAKNDYVAIEVWAKSRNSIYLVDLVNEHLDFPSTMRKIKLMKAKYPQAFITLIEDKANGTGIIQMLKKDIMGIIPVNPDASKEARVNAVAPVVEAGNVYLPKDCGFTFKFVDQCASFPNAKHDDMVDAFSQAVSRLAFSRTVRKLERQAKKGDRYFTLPHLKKTGKGEKINVI